MWRIEYQDDEFGPEWRFFADVDHTEATVDDIIDLMLWATGGVVEFRKTELEPVDEGVASTYETLSDLHEAGYEIVRKR